MLPDIVVKADELALDFDLWKEVVLSNFRSELATDQISSIDSIDRTLSELSDVGPEHWTDDAVRKSEEWNRIRALAAAALESFGWAREIPPGHADEYVGGT